MTRNHDDTEEYTAVRDAAYRRIFEALVNDGWTESAAATEAKFDAIDEAKAAVQAAHENAEACLHNSYMFDREFA